MTEELKSQEAPSQTTEFKEKIITSDAPIISEVTGAMPEVVPDAVAAAQQKADEIKSIQSEYKDNKGRAFDPNIHATDPVSGVPLMTPGGRFKAKTRQTLKGQGGVNLPQQSDALNDAKIKAAAQKFAQLFIVTGVSFFGEGWKPEKVGGVDEMTSLVEANERFMMEHGYVEPPAWVDLLFVYGIFIGKRVMQDQPTKNKVAVIVEKVKFWGINFWAKITGKDYKVSPRESK